MEGGGLAYIIDIAIKLFMIYRENKYEEFPSLFVQNEKLNLCWKCKKCKNDVIIMFTQIKLKGNPSIAGYVYSVS